jgi:hypothetical protein
MPPAAEIIIPLIQMDKDPRLGAQFRIPNVPGELGSGNLTGNPMVTKSTLRARSILAGHSHSIVRSGSIP